MEQAPAQLPEKHPHARRPREVLVGDAFLQGYGTDGEGLRVKYGARFSSYKPSITPGSGEYTPLRIPSFLLEQEREGNAQKEKGTSIIL